MIRSIFATLATFVAVSAIAPRAARPPASATPASPSRSTTRAFIGFDQQGGQRRVEELPVPTRLCLVNHFRGRVTCPYGQDQSGTALPTSDGASGGGFPGQDAEGNAYDRCLIPGGTDSTDSKQQIMRATRRPNGALVHPQCVDRAADKTVYCSCRCANVDGKTDDGANYCTCPDGFACTQLVNSIGATDDGLTGAYCIKQNTEYESFGSCETPCDPNAGGSQDCAPPSIQ